MNRLITDLLDLAKIKANGIEIHVAPELSTGLVNGAFEQSGPLAELRSIALLRDERIHATVSCDRERIMQVFDNILANAIKFSPEGSSVTLRVEPGEKVCTFSIVDHGPGIAPEHLPMLFDRFWTAPRTTAVNGTGLGLAIAKGVVEAHGGRLWVESTVGQGTSFFFTLPLTKG